MFIHRPSIDEHLNHIHGTVQQSKGKEVTAQLKVFKLLTLTQLLHHMPTNGMTF
jgi:hypothetical protein